MPRSIFAIPELCCPSEERLIRARLRPLPEIEALDFDFLRRELAVTHSGQTTPILDALHASGMQVQLQNGHQSTLRPPSDIADVHDHHSHHHDHEHSHGAASRLALIIAGLAALAAEATSWIGGNEHSPIVVILALIAMIAGGREVAWKGLRALRSGTWNIDLLTTIAVAGAAAIGHWSEAAMVTFLFGLAEAIEEHSVARARRAVDALLVLSPATARLRVGDERVGDERVGDERVGDEWREVPASQIAVGDRVRVLDGERLPMDGEVAAGQSSVDQSPITGESVPVEKSVGDAVFAGTINLGGTLEVRVGQTHDQSTLSRIVRAVSEAQSRRAPAQRFIDAFAARYTPGVVVAALLAAVAPPLLGRADWPSSIYNALVLLVIACPCALVLSTPVTIVSGLSVAAKRGILIKGGQFLEMAHRLRAVAFDKTGTLTEGTPRVVDFSPRSDEEAQNILRIAASLEAHSSHPLARSLVQFAAEHGAAAIEVEDFTPHTGLGVEGCVNGRKYFIGSAHALRERGVEMSQSDQGSQIGLMNEIELLATWTLRDAVRPASREAVAQLKARGLHTMMLSGDNAATATRIGVEVGVDEARGEMLPADKTQSIEQMRRERGAVAMIGDGINDAPALASADIGIAMGAIGSDTAIETADIALMGDDLRALPVLLDLSRATVSILRQNIAIALGLKILFFGLALSGHATLWMAVFADLGASLLVVANALRLLRFSPRED